MSFGSYGSEAFSRIASSDRARKGSKKQGKYALLQMGQARDDIRKGYDEAQGYWKPQYDYGQNALRGFQEWSDDPQSITSDPSYQFRLKQGQESLENSAAARGGALSGNALRAISDYGQESASQEYGNEFNRWMQKLGLGREATNAMAGLSERRGLGMGGMLGQAAQMRAGLGQQDFMNQMAIQQQARQDQKQQNDTIMGWFEAIFGGGGGMGGGMGGG